MNKAHSCSAAFFHGVLFAQMEEGFLIGEKSRLQNQ